MLTLLCRRRRAGFLKGKEIKYCDPFYSFSLQIVIYVSHAGKISPSDNNPFQVSIAERQPFQL